MVEKEKELELPVEIIKALKVSQGKDCWEKESTKAYAISGRKLCPQMYINLPCEWFGMDFARYVRYARKRETNCIKGRDIMLFHVLIFVCLHFEKWGRKGLLIHVLLKFFVY